MFELSINKKISNIIYNLIKISKHSDCDNKHAAAIIQNGKIISSGINCVKNNTVSLHAEVRAIQLFMYQNKCKKLDNYDLVVIRSKNNQIRMSKPCIHCLEFMKDKCIRRVYYSTNDGKIISEYIDTMESNHIASKNRFKHNK